MPGWAIVSGTSPIAMETVEHEQLQENPMSDGDDAVLY
jgi:hypothetical protein